MQGQINTLQAGRAIAALAVVAHHASVAVSHFNDRVPDIVLRVADYGYLGVDFFFVLSGFIIYYVNHDRTERPDWKRKYVESRIARIFVQYLPIGVGLAILYTALPQLSAGEQDWSWFPTLTLLPSNSGPALSVAWTLQHELVFYGLALLFFAAGRPILGMSLWAASIIAFTLLVPTTGAALFRIFGIINLEFLFGAIAAWAVINERLRNHWILSIAGVGSLIVFALVGGERDHSVLVGLGLAFLVPVIVRNETRGRLKVGAFMVLLGNASYAIYLIHGPLISLTVRVLRAVPGFDPWWIAMAVCIAVSTLAGVVYHKVYEAPALERARALMGKRKPLFPNPAR